MRYFQRSCGNVFLRVSTGIHDIMSKSRYGDMQEFVNVLYNNGYEVAELINTTDGMFMTKGEAAILGLSGSLLLVGKR